MFVKTESGRLVNLNFVEQIRIQDMAVIAHMHVGAGHAYLADVTLLQSEDPTELEEYLKALEDKVCAAV